jgi:hypothetical protein
MKTRLGANVVSTLLLPARIHPSRFVLDRVGLGIDSVIISKPWKMQLNAVEL